ncbi:MAG: serine/threonine-protein kinase, partial [Gemmatimonadaceae bacterium]
PELWSSAEPIIDAALDLPESERLAFLARACPDLSLREAIAHILRESSQTGGVLDRDVQSLASPLVPDAEAPAFEAEAAMIGPYRVLRELARGGMGIVYLAERADGQFKQQVALKLIRHGMGSDEIHHRFLVERQILARLNHPNIARLLDGGLSADGRPYFAMEYVDGVPITSHCDTRGLTIGARLALFEKVCEAVRIAHRSLVIHRDIKPSNILVVADGTVKLVDFGIAKMLGDDDDEQLAPETRAERRVMTPEYAAPEQVRGEPVTAATDVYALGAVLYELLTGRRAHRFARYTPAEVERVICETEPELPSDAAASAIQPASKPPITPADLSAARGLTIPRLQAALRGDLDTITTKALQKDPDRRYRTVDALIDDLQRFVTGRPVLARPDTFRYRAQKFVRRNRLAVGAASVVMLSLLGGLGAFVLQWRRTQLQAEHAAAARDFLADILSQAGPEQARGDSVTPRQMLDRASSRIDSAFRKQPDVQEQLYHTLGTIYRDLGVYPTADSMLQRAVAIADSLNGNTSQEAAAARGTLASIRIDLGEYASAESLIVFSLRVMRDRGIQGEVLVNTLDILGTAQRNLYRFREAEASYREAIAIAERQGVDSLILAAEWGNLSVVLSQTGRLESGDSALARAIEIQKARLPPNDPGLVLNYMNLAVGKDERWQLDSALTIHDEVVRRQRQIYPDGHERVAAALNNRAWNLMSQRRYAEAESGFRESYSIVRRLSGPTHLVALIALNNAGRAALLDGRSQKAAPIFVRVRAEARAALGEAHGFISAPMLWLGYAVAARGDTAGALALWDSTLAHARAHLPREHPRLSETLVAISSVLLKQHRAADAEPLVREALELQRASLSDRDPAIQKTTVMLGVSRALQGDRAIAESLLATAVSQLRGRKFIEADAAEAQRTLDEWRAKWGPKPSTKK